MKKIVVTAACLLLLPLAPLAAEYAPGRLPPQAAIDACVGKAVGSAVKLPDKSGKIVSATCKNVNGQLIAVRKSNKRKHKQPSTGGATEPAPDALR